MENKSFCVHGHFYQPPREDPLTSEVPIEPGAAPYRNWNERINARCYRPNAQLGNFERISFNIGPTLLSWMQKNDPETLNMIIEQEHRNLEKYGVGNGLAQAYSHTILPLAKYHDKVTQVMWGIADFEYYFGHKPQGMWLPETAVDDETLTVLAECGIEFTILAPWQADSDTLDPSHPYRVELPGGREITIFFYNQDLSTRVSFDPGATVNADRFVLEHVLPKYQSYNGHARQPQMVMVASDGELYGHHQPFRDKFLSYLMDGAIHQQPVDSVFPALWMRNHKAVETISIRQKSSWSCYHGIVRWSGDCRCTANNDWKAPMREALDRLAEAIDEQYLAVVSQFLNEPWELRHQYIHVLHGATTLEELITLMADHPVCEKDLQQIDCLLKAQFERQRMFTSCGWFFDDFSRIEPRNNIAYAAQAVWLTSKATGVDLSSLALSLLMDVKSSLTGLCADEVFRHHLYRANRAWGDEGQKQ